MEWIMTQVNMVGKAFVGLALPMLLTSTVLIGLVLLVESVLRARVRAGLRYWLVTCVLAYLVLIPLLSLSPPSTHWPTGMGSPHRDSSRLGASDCLRRRGPQHSFRWRWANPTSSTPARHTHAPLSPPTTGQTGLASANDRGQEPSQTTLGGVGERPRTLILAGSVFLLWLIGAVAIMGGVLIRRAVAACRRLDRVPVANNLMNDILALLPQTHGHPGHGPSEGRPSGDRPVRLRPVAARSSSCPATSRPRSARDTFATCCSTNWPTSSGTTSGSTSRRTSCRCCTSTIPCFWS